MEVAEKLTDLQKRVSQHREFLSTEEAAKTALVMPFIQALGYDVFNPSEVIPEFTCDVGTKKGEKVDYAICRDGSVSVLIECKPVGGPLNVSHASQLFRYFSVTDARLAILTNGAVFQFYADVEQPNRMDEKPFFTFNLDALRPTDAKTIDKFTKANFDIDSIIEEASSLKLQSQLRQEIEKELASPSEEFVVMLARRVHEGKLTPAIRESFNKHVGTALAAAIRELVSDRLAKALNSEPVEQADKLAPPPSADEIITTEEEISGYRIVQAIAAKLVNPSRVHLRDAKSYAAILLDDNNRKAIARLYFNAATVKYVSTFSGKDEVRHQIDDLTGIYGLADQIEARLKELEG